MKNLFATLLLIASAYLTSGQVIYSDSREDYLMAMQRNKNFRAHIAAGNIASVQTFGYKRTNATGYLMYESRYDKRGNNTDWIMYNNGKVKMRNTTDYDDSNRVTEYASYNRTGKLKGMGKNTYDKAGNLIEQDVYKKNPQTINSKTTRTYDSKNNITESKTFDKKGNLKNRIEYTYYDDGSKKQTMQYSGSGKLIRIWNFDCNPVGTIEAKKFKDTSKVCIHYETDKNGNPIKVKEEYTGAGMFGRTIRTVSKYDKNNNQIDAATYALNGKELSHWSGIYNASGKVTEYITYKSGTQKILYRSTYEYNSDGNITEGVAYKNSQKPLSKWKYVYSSSLSPSPAK